MSQNWYISRWLNLKIKIWVLNSHDRCRSIFYVFWKVILQKYLIKWSEDMKRITAMLQSLTTTITLHISPSLSPPCRAGFPSIVACETESAAHSAWPAIHSSWTDWWKTINRLYILLGHSGSPALILDTWTYILGYRAEVRRQKRRWDGNWPMGSQTPGWGACGAGMRA